VYRISYFILNDKTSHGNTIFDGSVSCTHGRGPSPTDVEASGVVRVLSATEAIENCTALSIDSLKMTSVRCLLNVKELKFV
jgi:hypothetical protein